MEFLEIRQLWRFSLDARSRSFRVVDALGRGWPRRRRMIRDWTTRRVREPGMGDRLAGVVGKGVRGGMGGRQDRG